MKLIVKIKSLSKSMLCVITGMILMISGFTYKFGLADGIILLGIFMIVLSMLLYIKDNPI